MEGYSFRTYETTIQFYNKGEKSNDWDHQYKHYDILNQLFEYMKTLGFKIGSDPRVDKDYPTLSKDHFHGIKNKLAFESHRYFTGFELKFYNIETGRYKTNFKELPYLLQKMVINESTKIINYLEKQGYQNNVEIKYKTAEDRIKNFYVKSCHHPQKDMNFSLSDLDGECVDSMYYGNDRDGKKIFNGQIKYYYHRGRLARGKVYSNGNSMWWVIKNKHDYDNESSYNLFDPTPEDFKCRRKIGEWIPWSYANKLAENNVVMSKMMKIYNNLQAKDFKTIFKYIASSNGYKAGEHKTENWFDVSGDKYKSRGILRDVVNKEIIDGIQIVVRSDGGHYVILEYKGDRIFECDGRGAFNLDFKLMDECYKKYEFVFKGL
jgi:hypothetical protein